MNQKINRRAMLKYSSFLMASGVAMSDVVWADEDKPVPKSSRFMIYVHFGSQCGVANGLLQPSKSGEWPLGWFQAGAATSAMNPLLNQHTASGNLIFHDYMKFLAPMTDHMCLANIHAQSLDHDVAALYQMRGHNLVAAGTEWPMAITENMKGFKSQNPMVVSSGLKSLSTSDITTLMANSLAEFSTITSDVNTIPKGKLDPIWKVTSQQFKNAKLGSVAVDESLAGTVDYQLKVLTNGLPELTAAKADIDALTAQLNAGKVNALVAASAEKAAIAQNADQNTKNKFILAGILAKTGLAHGMRMDLIGDDAHRGGSDIASPRNAAGKWAIIALFWEWVKAQGLQEDIMIVVGQEFSRSPYNTDALDQTYIDATGEPKTIRTPGRDHGLSAGMMFINANVPKAGRIGNVSTNLVPLASKDTKGTLDTSTAPYTSADVMGSMLMRVYPDLFPTERMVRKHWPSFVEISNILT